MPENLTGKFIPEPDGHKYAIDMVKQVAEMNKGNYLDSNIVNGEKSDFCIGIAGYPEKHFESPNFQSDLQHTKAKVDAGANYIVTQMFFDNQSYFKYIDACKAIGINVPVVPGLKPITKKHQLSSLPRLFHVDLPDAFTKEFYKAKTPEAIKEIGIEWCIEQSKELKKRGVPCLHYYTMGDADTIKRIAEAVF